VNERDEKRLASLSQNAKALADFNDQLRREANALQSRLVEKDRHAEETGQRLVKATDLLHNAEAQSKRLQGLADEVPGLTEELRKAHTDLARIEAKLHTSGAEAEARRTDLTDANRAIAALERDKKSLLERVVRVTSAAENRFEGIALTGRRVIFLVDMSGSMELVDERTPAEQKWKGVRETVSKVMRSLPELSKYQLILFSDHVSYPLGGENRWLEFEPKGSASDAYAALSRIRPRGATNMYDAFEAAFRYRPLGLDTIYVLSDGLPNVGPGLTALEQTNPANENERSTLLARHIRSVLLRDWNRAVLGQSRVRINTIGFFYESPDVGAFLWALSRENDGSFVGMSKP
jgi:Mg-chelatase subunit ChlD